MDVVIFAVQDGEDLIIYGWDKVILKNAKFVQLLTLSNYLIVCCVDRLYFIQPDRVSIVNLPSDLMMATTAIYNDELYIYLLFSDEIVRYEVHISQLSHLPLMNAEREPFSLQSLKLKTEDDKAKINVFKDLLKSQPSSQPVSQPTSQTVSKNNSSVNLKSVTSNLMTPQHSQHSHHSQHTHHKSSSDIEDDVMRKVQKQLQDQQSLQNAKYESFLKVVSQSLKQGLSDSFDKFSKQQPASSSLDVEEVSNAIVASVESKIQKTLKTLVVDAFIPKLELIVDHLLKQVDSAVEQRVDKAIKAALKNNQSKSKPTPKKEKSKDIMTMLQSSKQHLFEDSDNDEELTELYKNNKYSDFVEQCLLSQSDELSVILNHDPDQILNELSPITLLQLINWLFNHIDLDPNAVILWIRKGLLKINHRVLSINIG